MADFDPIYVASLINLGKKVNATVGEFSHGQGEVRDPKNDMRLKENQEKIDKEEQERLQEEQKKLEESMSPSAQGASHETKDLVPHERERADHRASLKDKLAAVMTSNVPAGPLGTSKSPMTSNIPAGPLPRVGPKPPAKSKNFTVPSLHTDQEMAIRNHPKWGPYANKALGPGPADAATLKGLHGKIKNLQSMASDTEEKNSLQKYASMIAGLILIS